MNPIPLLILSDAPTSGTGLGRITKDLATRIAADLPEVFRVSTLGYGGPNSRLLPFHQYSIDMQDWVVFNLPEVWEDFAGKERGIVMTIWDSSRLLWLARPENCPEPKMRKFLQAKPFQTWAYLPIDATGPHDRLTAVLKHTISGFDRVLAYSKWAEDILRRTLLHPHEKDWNGLTNLPHGIDCSVFKPRHRSAARHGFGERMGARSQKGKWINIPDDAFLVGIVATNQTRKDFALGIQTVAELAKDRNLMVWIHTDELERHWSIPGLLNDFGLLNQAIVTTVPYTDEQMSWAYSACDVTLAIGLGEGFGFSAAESLACGVPTVAPNYGGGEFIPKEFLVEPIAWRIEGVYSCLRPVLDPKHIAAKVIEVSGTKVKCPEYIDWNNLWPRWKEWLTCNLAAGELPPQNLADGS